MQARVARYDKSGEEHYNLISAYHKALRGSDPQGALYWLARMIEGGEDPMYIARRTVRFAAEDVGLADPTALRVALDARDTYHFLGSPEGELALAEAAVYLATAPKSNSVYRAWGAALGPGPADAGGGGPAPPPERPHETHERPGLRTGLPICAWRARGIHSTGLPAGCGGWEHALRAGAIRLREGDRQAAGVVGGSRAKIERRGGAEAQRGCSANPTDATG